MSNHKKLLSLEEIKRLEKIYSKARIGPLEVCPEEETEESGEVWLFDDGLPEAPQAFGIRAEITHGEGFIRRLDTATLLAEATNALPNLIATAKAYRMVANQNHDVLIEGAFSYQRENEDLRARVSQAEAENYARAELLEGMASLTRRLEADNERLSRVVEAARVRYEREKEHACPRVRGRSGCITCSVKDALDNLDLANKEY